MEDKNRELSDEIKFLEKDRLEQWGKYEALVREKQSRATESTATTTGAGASSTSRLGSSHFDLDAERDLRTVNDLFAIKDTADELLRGWQARPTRDEDDEATTGTSHAHVNSEGDQRGAAEETVKPSDTTTTKTVAFARDHDDDNEPRRNDEPKHVVQDIVQPGGKREVSYSDGSRTIFFADGNEKEIEASGHTTIKFTNGDRKEVRACVVLCGDVLLYVDVDLTDYCVFALVCSCFRILALVFIIIMKPRQR